MKQLSNAQKELLTEFKKGRVACRADTWFTWTRGNGHILTRTMKSLIKMNLVEIKGDNFTISELGKMVQL